MKSEFAKTDSNGKIARAGEGCGFAILPGRPRTAKTERPGSFPVTVVTRKGKRLPVTGPHAYYFGEDEGPVQFDVENATPGAGYNVISFTSPHEGVRPGGSTRLTSRVQSATAIGTAAPVNGDASGFEVRTGTESWTAYAAGVLDVARVWVQDLDGVWTDTGVDVDFISEPVSTRNVKTVGRVYLRGAAGTMTLAIDVTEVVG